MYSFFGYCLVFLRDIRRSNLGGRVLLRRYFRFSSIFIGFFFGLRRRATVVIFSIDCWV